MNDSLSSPLDDSSYCFSVVETLRDSVEDCSSVSFHDLLDAYNTLVRKVQSQGQALQACDKQPPAFKCFLSCASILFQAFRRDIRLAHVDPLSADVSFPFSQERRSPYNTDSLANLKQRARNLSILCSYALSALAVVFRFTALFSLFTVSELAELLGEVATIASARTLPVFNSPKIHSLSLWILCSQQLPHTAIIPQELNFKVVLRRCLDTPNQPTTATRGLQVVIHMLQCNIKDFFGLLSDILPLVLRCILSQSDDVRSLTTVTLSKFAAILVHETGNITKQDRLAVSFYTLDFLREQYNIFSSGDTLLQVVHTASQAVSPAVSGIGPVRMAAALASLVLLSGPALFSNTQPLEFLLEVIGVTLTHENSFVRALHPCIWRCLIWTWAQMLARAETFDSDMMDLSFRAIKKELTGGLGATVTSILLRKCNPDYSPLTVRGNKWLEQGFSVVQCMIYGECPSTQKQGIALLQLITIGSSSETGGSPLSEDFRDVLPMFLVDGAVLDIQLKDLPSLIRKNPVAVARSLTEPEIGFLYEILFEEWSHRMANSSTIELEVNLAKIWCLLLESVRQTRTGTQALLKLAATSLTAGLLPSLPLPCTWGSWSVTDQLRRLVTLDKHWFTMKNIFDTVHLPQAARIVLSAILQYEFHILDGVIGRNWSRLCADLIVTAPLSFLDGTSGPEGSKMCLKTRSSLWGAIATSLDCSAPGLHGQGLVDFLYIPICGWVLSESELRVWESLFQCAVTLTGKPYGIAGSIIERLNTEEIVTGESMVQMFTVLLSTVQRGERERLPPDNILCSIDYGLTLTYNNGSIPPAPSKHALALLASLRDYILALSPRNTMAIIVALRNGLSLWMEDKVERLTDEDFNAVIIPLYCDTLKVLENLPLSLEGLQMLEPFLASGFSRIPVPAIAPFAFEKFWRATYHGQTQFYDKLPPRIQSCLVCFASAYGGDLASGLSVSTESQSPSQNLFAVHASITEQTTRHPCPQVDHELRCEPCGTHSVDAKRDHSNSAILDLGMDLPSAIDNAFILQSRDATPQNSPRSDLFTNCPINDSQHLLASLHHLSNSTPAAKLSSAPQPLRNKRRQDSGAFKRRKRRCLVSNSSTPIHPKIIFDCVEVPTLKSVWGPEDILCVGNTRTSRAQSPRTPPTVSRPVVGRTPWSPLPPSVSSEDQSEDDAWDGCSRPGRTSSEFVVDASLARVCTSSPSQIHDKASQGNLTAIEPSQLELAHAGTESHNSEQVARQIDSHSESPVPGPSPPPLSRSKTRSLDAL